MRCTAPALEVIPSSSEALHCRTQDCSGAEHCLGPTAQSAPALSSSRAPHTDAAAAEAVVLIAHLAVTAVAPGQVVAQLPLSTPVHPRLTLIHICRARHGKLINYSLLKTSVYKEKQKSPLNSRIRNWTEEISPASLTILFSEAAVWFSKSNLGKAEHYLQRENGNWTCNGLSQYILHFSVNTLILIKP